MTGPKAITIGKSVRGQIERESERPSQPDSSRSKACRQAVASSYVLV